MKQFFLTIAFLFAILVFAAGCSPKDKQGTAPTGPAPKPEDGAGGSVKVLPPDKIPKDPRQ